jgi:hypothetical protein
MRPKAGGHQEECAMNVKLVLAGLSALIVSALAMPAQAINLVTNGSFEQTSLSTSGFLTNSDVTGWTTTSGYTFEVFPGTETTTGIGNGVKLYPGAGGTIPTSPDGFKYLAADGGYQTGTTSQTINGLVVGQKYALTFYQAAAQQQGYTGATTDYWQVSLGAETHNSTVMNNPSQSFTGWQAQSLLFTATATSEVLGFMAVGTPSGQPPFALLDGVALNAVPEPATWTLMIIGLLAIFAARAWYNRRGPLSAEAE